MTIQFELDSPASLRQFINSTPVVVWLTDADGVCVYVNHPGFRPGQFRGLIFAAWLGLLELDDTGTVRDSATKAVESRQSYHVNYQALTVGGTPVWRSATGMPRYSAEGVFEGYVCAIFDITQQMEAFAQLAKSEANYRLLAENSSDLICHCDAEGKYLYVSPSYNRKLGFPEGALPGQSVFAYVHPDDIEKMEAEVGRQYEGGEPGGAIELRKLRVDGDYLWVATTIQALFDPTGVPIGSVSTSRDITQERQAKEERRRSEARFRSLTQLSADWYWETDAQGRLTFVSEGILAATGVAPDQLIGLTREQLAGDHPGPEVAAYLEHAAKREPFRNVPFSCAHSLFKKRHHTLVSAEPMFEGGEFTGYRGITRDVSEERGLVEKLRQLAEENEALLNNTLDVIADLDDEGCILQINSAVQDTLGYAPAELLGQPYMSMLDPAEIGRVSEAYVRLRTEDETLRNFETRWLRKNGTTAHLSLSARWLADNKTMYATARDISSVRQAEEDLHRVNQQVASILENIADAFFSLDTEWRVTYANLRTADFVGVDRARAIGQYVWDVVPGFRETSIFQRYEEAARTQQAVFFEEYYGPANAWVDIRAYPHEGGLSVFFHDITQKRQAEQVIKESESRFREVIALTPVGYVATDAAGMVLEVNPALCAMSGYTREEFIGRDVLDFLPARPGGRALELGSDESFARGKEMALRHKAGHLTFILVNLTIKRDPEGRPQSLTAFVSDISERKQAERQLEQIATHDALTGLPNRILVNRHLAQVLCSPRADDSLAVMFMDLDGFKEINDSLGHASGDFLLREVALRLRACLAGRDLVARLGGDEFVIVTPCSNGKASATALAERLLSSLEPKFEIGGHEVYVSGSLGICMLGEGSRTKELLFQNADAAMYRAKGSGPGQYCFFEQAMTAEARRRIMLETSLRHAVERQDFRLHYQPRIDLATSEIVGMEALVRWDHPDLGPVSPAEFVPIAEQKGFIVAIGHWVLREACFQAKAMIDEHHRLFRVSVNISAHQLKSRDLVGQVAAALHDSGLPAAMLELELTETALIDDVEQSARVLQELKTFGVNLAVDDFGTGYSGLSYLRRFPVDVLKLDRSFIMEHTEGISKADFIKAVVDMAHTLKLDVVGEGVETEETRKLLADAGCDEGQGYFFSRPMSGEDLTRTLSARYGP